MVRARVRQCQYVVVSRARTATKPALNRQPWLCGRNARAPVGHPASWINLIGCVGCGPRSRLVHLEGSRANTCERADVLTAVGRRIRWKHNGSRAKKLMTKICRRVRK